MSTSLTLEEDKQIKLALKTFFKSGIDATKIFTKPHKTAQKMGIALWICGDGHFFRFKGTPSPSCNL